MSRKKKRVRRNPISEDPRGRLQMFEGAPPAADAIQKITALLGTRSPLDRSYRGKRHHAIYAEQTAVWARQSHDNSKKDVGEVYLCVLSMANWGIQRYKAYIRARSAPAAREAFYNYLVHEAGLDIASYFPNNMYLTEILTNVIYHSKVPKKLQDLADDVADFIYANSSWLRDPTSLSVRHKVELRVEYTLAPESRIGFRDRDYPNTLYEIQHGNAIRLIPTLVGDDGVGVVFHEYAEAEDAIRTWVEAARRRTDFMTIRSENRGL